MRKAFKPRVVYVMGQAKKKIPGWGARVAEHAGKFIFSTAGVGLAFSAYAFYKFNNKTPNENNGDDFLSNLYGKSDSSSDYDLEVKSLNENYEGYTDALYSKVFGPKEDKLIRQANKVIRLFNELDVQTIFSIHEEWQQHFATINENKAKLGAEYAKEKSARDEEVIKACTKIDNETSLQMSNLLKALFNPQGQQQYDNLISQLSVSEFQVIASRLFRTLSKRYAPKLFVLSFPGDTSASQVARLREEVSAILLSSKPGKDVVAIKLNTGGGTVTGYGLAAAQLERLKSAGFHVVVLVDEVAASGGYMMAAVAHEVIAAPFSMLGSIGVISTAPNITERLEREGITVDDVTAGKYKRTLTLYKRPTEEDRAKVQEDVNKILDFFKRHIQKHRPALDIESVATGEVWLGEEARTRGLCDQVMTVDEYLLLQYKKGFNILSLRYAPFVKPQRFGQGYRTVMDSFVNAMAARFAESFTQQFQQTIFNSNDVSSLFGGRNENMLENGNNNNNNNNILMKNNGSSNNSLTNKYMAIDTSIPTRVN